MHFNNIFLELNEILVLIDFNLLVCSFSDKSIVFFNYITESFIKRVEVKSGCSCLSLSKAYGVILYGTNDFTIQKIDLADIMDSINQPHNFKKYHFMEDPRNYEVQKGKININ